MKDSINPAHYTSGKVECIDALEAATSVAGSRVTGTVCGGLIAKGSVIHIEGVE